MTGGFEATAKLGDVGVNDVGAGIKGIAPDTGPQHRSCDDLVAIKQQILEQRELLLRQLDALIANADFSRCLVECERAAR